MKKEFSMKLFWIGILGLFLFLPLALIQNLADKGRKVMPEFFHQIGSI